MTEEFTEDGMPVFIDTSGHLSAHQKQELYRRIARLEEGERDNRAWLRDIEIRLDELVEVRGPKKKWWERWRK